MGRDKNFGYRPGECLRVSTNTKSVVGVFEKLDPDEMYLRPSLVYEPVYRYEKMPDGTIRQIEEPFFREETERPTRITIRSIILTEPVSIKLYESLRDTEINIHINTPKHCVNNQ